MSAETDQRKAVRRARAEYRRLKKDFYGAAMTESDRIPLRAAETVEGLDKEIAILRTSIRKFVDQQPENLELMIKSMDVLRKMVAVRYRISKNSQADLSAALAKVIQGVGDQLIPEAVGE
jgi:hypothetical protein